jgi:hypothetical protein
MNKRKKVALNFSKLSVPQKISKSRLLADSLEARPDLFINPVPSPCAIREAAEDLHKAFDASVNGGTHLTAFMHDKEADLMALLRDAAAYVERIAKGDEEVIHLSSLSVKKVGKVIKPDFEVFLPDDLGAVGLRCRARKKTLYRWEYSADPMTNNTFIVSHSTDVSSTFIGNLESDKPYWFRVVIVDAQGEHALAPKCIVTN